MSIPFSEMPKIMPGQHYYAPVKYLPREIEAMDPVFYQALQTDFKKVPDLPTRIPGIQPYIDKSIEHKYGRSLMKDFNRWERRERER